MSSSRLAISAVVSLDMLNIDRNSSVPPNERDLEATTSAHSTKRKTSRKKNASGED